MTIEQTPTSIICDYCGNADYYFGSIKIVEKQAISSGWLKYKGKHFDTPECLNSYRKENR